MNIFVGLDGEMTGTGSPYDTGHRLIQIGLAMRYEGGLETISSEIGWAAGQYSWQDEALEVNGFTHSRIRSGPPAVVADGLLVEWLRARANATEEEERFAVAVGWNVAGFDMPYVRVTLPQVSKAFHYRTVDLNAVVFTLAHGVDTGRPSAYKRWKKRAKRAAEEALKERFGEAQWHDAEYDAAAALASWEYLLQQVKEAEWARAQV